MKQRILLFFCLLLSTLTASAYYAKIGEVCYNLDSSTHQATVTYYNMFDEQNYYSYSGNVVIPATVTYNSVTYSVTSIGDDAFADCSDLTSVTIPNSVTSIGNNAFYSCTGLVFVTMSNSVTTIGKLAFGQCSALTSITIPNSVTSIGDDAFSGCSVLKSVNIGNSVTSIGNYAFYGCSDLKDVYCYAEEVPSTSIYAFYELPISSATLHVPAASVDAYKATEPWSGFGSVIALDDPGLRGDVNGDGTVNGTDIQAIINFIVASEYDEKADVNEDGTVNGTDIQEVINIIVEGE